MWQVSVCSHMCAGANRCVGNIRYHSVSGRPSGGVWEGTCWTYTCIHGVRMGHTCAPSLWHAAEGMLGAGRPGEDLWEGWAGSVREEPLRAMQWRRGAAFNSPAQTFLAWRKSGSLCPCPGAELQSQPTAHRWGSGENLKLLWNTKLPCDHSTWSTGPHPGILTGTPAGVCLGTLCLNINAVNFLLAENIFPCVSAGQCCICQPSCQLRILHELSGTFCIRDGRDHRCWQCVTRPTSLQCSAFSLAVPGGTLRLEPRSPPLRCSWWSWWAPIAWVICAIILQRVFVGFIQTSCAEHRSLPPPRLHEGKISEGVKLNLYE